MIAHVSIQIAEELFLDFLILLFRYLIDFFRPYRGNNLEVEMYSAYQIL